MKLGKLFTVGLIMSALTLSAEVGTSAAYANQESTDCTGGTVAGAAIGLLFGKGNGKILAAGIGAVAGNAVGCNIGKKLDEKERENLQSARLACLNNYSKCVADSQVGRWNGDHSNTYGQYIYVRPVYHRYHREWICREYRHDYWVQGEHDTQTGEACNDGRGNWSDVKTDEITYENPYGADTTVVTTTSTSSNDPALGANPEPLYQVRLEETCSARDMNGNRFVIQSGYDAYTKLMAACGQSSGGSCSYEGCSAAYRVIQ